jgi:replication-associated recombination protein RarA
MEQLIAAVRPNSIDDMYFGKAAVRKALTAKIATGNLPWFILLHSNCPGVGKTTIAYILRDAAKRIHKVPNLQYKEIDGNEVSKVEQIRSLLQEFRSVGLTRIPIRVLIINEFHGLSKDAQEALLTFTETCKEHRTLIIGTTTELDSIRSESLKSRAWQVKLDPIQSSDILKLLRETKEKFKFKTPDTVLQVLSEHVGGSPRIALSSLELVSDLEDHEDCIAVLGLAEQEAVNAIIHSIAKVLFFNKAGKAQGLREIEAFRAKGGDLAAMIIPTMRMATNALVGKTDGTVSNPFEKVVAGNVEHIKLLTRFVERVTLTNIREIDAAKFAAALQATANGI